MGMFDWLTGGSKSRLGIDAQSREENVIEEEDEIRESDYTSIVVTTIRGTTITYENCNFENDEGAYEVILLDPKGESFKRVIHPSTSIESITLIERPSRDD